jgi:hypothetical protein
VSVHTYVNAPFLRRAIRRPSSSPQSQADPLATVHTYTSLSPPLQPEALGFQHAISQLTTLGQPRCGLKQLIFHISPTCRQRADPSVNAHAHAHSCLSSGGEVQSIPWPLQQTPAEDYLTVLKSGPCIPDGSQLYHSFADRHSARQA